MQLTLGTIVNRPNPDVSRSGSALGAPRLHNLKVRTLGVYYGLRRRHLQSYLVVWIIMDASADGITGQPVGLGGGHGGEMGGEEGVQAGG